MMDKSIAGQVYNIADLEKEIEAEVWNSPPIRGQRSVDFVPPRVRAPTTAIPDYVEHREGATEVGQLSAGARVRAYEAAAQEVERRGARRAERVRACGRT